MLFHSERRENVARYPELAPRIIPAVMYQSLPPSAELIKQGVLAAATRGGHVMLPGQTAVALSHQRAWQAIVAEVPPHEFAVVLEDDFDVKPDFRQARA